MRYVTSTLLHGSYSEQILQEQNSTFNRQVAMNVRWMNGKQIRHIVDLEKFQNAMFINWKTSHEIWNEFMDWWASLYTGLAEIIRLDWESSFASRELWGSAKDMRIHLQFSGIKAHSPNGKRTYITAHWEEYSK